MTKIKSFTTNDGDMFYINHDSDNFTIIDCCIDEERKDEIINELKGESKNKGITRFISTHPDDDHIRNLKYLDDKMPIVNFYCVKNETKKDDPTDDFNRYCELRNDSKKAYHISKGCSRKWMNESSDERDSANINIKWPDVDNKKFKDALEIANNGDNPNNISPIITLDLINKVYWFGDLENDFLENIKDDVEWDKADIIFAPHHGRNSGTIPKDVLEELDPKIIIIGDGPSEYLNYYQGYDTITQNSADDIMIMYDGQSIDFYVSNLDYSKTFNNLKKLSYKSMNGYKYLGSIVNE